ncbi:hypothetical protein KC878_03050 [Candidatus Saccharibacteria bacterium]|nr:hypothetical protein [Candidatus Saccharibacteria bacterium]MCB9820944.1 hypothetical protein [Candidatus Nomurabacteria bacterium]
MHIKHFESRREGFGHVLGFIGLILCASVVVIAGTYVYRKQAKQPNNSEEAASSSLDNSWLKDCSSNERVSMQNLPMDIENVDSISPYGLTAGAHVTPIDHLYFYPKNSDRDAFPVYAMADGYIVEVGARGVMVDSGESRPPEYRIIFQHSCQTVSYFDLVTKLDDIIAKQVGDLGSNGSKGSLRIPVKAGQEIGRIGAQSLDTAVYNFSITLPGFIHPEMYESEPWKVHTDDFYSYFSSSLQDKMLSKSTRQAKPYSGKIDYDIPGKLIGNWFKEGTNGYAGVSGSGGGTGSNGYWVGHLALLYYANDPQYIIISLGDYQGSPKAFAVKGNTPDPATIGVDSGVVKYELIEAPNGGGGSVSINQNSQVQATALFQVLENEKLKTEVFPGQSGAEITGFTDKALSYER